MSTRADQAVDTAAEKLESFVQRARTQGGLQGQLAEQLEDDPTFLLKLKPSLVKKRLHGETPPAPPTHPSPTTNGRPQPSGPKGRGGGRGPLVVLGLAFALGLLLAKGIDWRSHAHPRA